MPSTTSAIVVAVIAAVASLLGSVAVEISRRRSVTRLQERTAADQERLKRLEDELGARREAANKAAQAAEVMATYRDPLARSAYDLQSRIYNIYRGWRGRRDPEYFRHNTLFVVAEFLGWLEIVRREIQFLDADVDASTRELQEGIERVRDALAESWDQLGMDDDLYLYRGEQRAIGELMIVESPARSGPVQTCRGYASFVDRLDDATVARWFERFGDAIDGLREHKPQRLVQVQHALIDLIDLLDVGRLRFPGDRDKIDPSWASE